MVNKIILTAAIIATAIAAVCVAAQEMANAEHGELVLKLMAFISLILIDIYVIVGMFKGSNKDK